MKTAIILLITAGIVYKVFSVIYKEYKKNKNFQKFFIKSSPTTEFLPALTE